MVGMPREMPSRRASVPMSNPQVRGRNHMLRMMYIYIYIYILPYVHTIYIITYYVKPGEATWHHGVREAPFICSHHRYRKFACTQIIIKSASCILRSDVDGYVLRSKPPKAAISQLLNAS